MAEKIAGHLINKNGYDISAESAGLYVEPGSAMPAEAVQALAGLGIKSGGYTAKQLNPEDIAAADLVISMSHEIKIAIGGCKNSYALTELIGGRDIPDPLGKGIRFYKIVAEYLFAAIEELLKRLSKGEII